MVKNNIFKLLAVLFFGSGIILTGYPLFSDYLFESQTNEQIKCVVNQSNQIENEIISEWVLAAREYNEKLYECQSDLIDPFTNKSLVEMDDAYQDTLSMDESGIMGYIQIPAIDLEYPIYHGTSADVLLQGIGHMQGSSFPVGGKNTHAVLAGHSGINQRRLFTDLENLEPGNVIFINVLNEEYIYEVDQTIVIEPDDIEHLSIIPGEDMITLVTCTPYGVNSHRLLVRAKRAADAVPKQELYERERKYSKASIYDKKRNQNLILLAGFIAVIVITQVSLNMWGINRRKRS